MDFDQPSAASPFYIFDPLDGFSTFLDQSEEVSDAHETLASFVGGAGGGSDLGIIDNVDSGYNSGADFFSTSSIVDCSNSTSSESFHFRLSFEQPVNDCYTSDNADTYSDINNNNLNRDHNDNINCNNINNNNNNGTNTHNLNSNNDNQDSYDYSYNLISNNFSNNIDNQHVECIRYYNNYTSSNGDSNNVTSEPASQTKTSSANKRSVLMNLLIDGSDVGAGYTCHSRY